MSDVIRPKDEDQLAKAVAEAADAKTPLEIVGAGTKREVGRPLQTAARLSVAKLAGVTLYEPNELVLSARAGTPLAEVEKTLAKNNQMLAFEPIDLGPLLGGKAGRGTIGAVFATNLSGSRRVLAGAARDHLLGIRAVNGRGEAFRNGGRVMKNVTGYDLCRGIAGSWGTLAVLTEVTMKVLPQAEATRTLILRGLTEEVAADAMCAALGTPFEVTGAVHLPGPLASAMGISDLVKRGQSVTALRLENFKTALDYRTGRLREALAAYGKAGELDDKASRTFWDGMRRLSFLEGGEGSVWRISAAPTNGPRLVKSVSAHMKCQAAYDWSGGLIWLLVAPYADAGAVEVRRAVAELGGYATLIRADAGVRGAVDVFQPMAPGIEGLTRRLKAAFDPEGILNPGRMYAGL